MATRWLGPILPRPCVFLFQSGKPTNGSTGNTWFCVETAHFLIVLAHVLKAEENGKKRRAFWFPLEQRHSQACLARAGRLGSPNAFYVFGYP